MDRIQLTQVRITSEERSKSGTIFTERDILFRWVEGVMGLDGGNILPGFLTNWRSWTITLGKIPSTEVAQASSLDKALDKNAERMNTVNAYIYGTIITVSGLSTQTKTPIPKPGTANDNEFSKICVDAQLKAVELLMSSVAWVNKGKIEAGVDLDFDKTFVDWPVALGLPPGVPARPISTSNSYSVIAYELRVWLESIYVSQGPGAMYAAIQLIKIPSIAFAGSLGSRAEVANAPLAAQGGVSKWISVYNDPGRANEAKDKKIYIRTLGEWARIALARQALYKIKETSINRGQPA